jgi:hypothetical protein
VEVGSLVGIQRIQKLGDRAVEQRALPYHAESFDVSEQFKHENPSGKVRGSDGTGEA